MTLLQNLSCYNELFRDDVRSQKIYKLRGFRGGFFFTTPICWGGDFSLFLWPRYSVTLSAGTTPQLLHSTFNLLSLFFIFIFQMLKFLGMEEQARWRMSLTHTPVVARVLVDVSIVLQSEPGGTVRRRGNNQIYFPRFEVNGLCSEMEDRTDQTVKQDRGSQLCHTVQWREDHI